MHLLCILITNTTSKKDSSWLTNRHHTNGSPPSGEPLFAFLRSLAVVPTAVPSR